jgi:hypothetical protein
VKGEVVKDTGSAASLPISGAAFFLLHAAARRGVRLAAPT